MNFTTSLDKFSKLISTAVTLLFLFVMYSQFQLLRYTDQTWVPIATGLFFVVVYALSFSLRPLSYTVDNGELIIHRYLSNVTIQRSNIQRVSLLPKEDIARSVRTFGNGGLFGYVGKFYNKKMGRMTWYVTRRDSLVLIETKDDRKIVLSPDDAPGLVQAMTF